MVSRTSNRRLFRKLSAAACCFFFIFSSMYTFRRGCKEWTKSFLIDRLLIKNVVWFVFCNGRFCYFLVLFPSVKEYYRKIVERRKKSTKFTVDPFFTKLILVIMKIIFFFMEIIVDNFTSTPSLKCVNLKCLSMEIM